MDKREDRIEKCPINLVVASEQLQFPLWLLKSIVQYLRSQTCTAHSEKDTSRKQWIHESSGITNEQKTRAIEALTLIRPIASATSTGNTFGCGEQSFSLSGLRNHLKECLL